MGRKEKNSVNVACGENTVVGLGTVVNGDITSEAVIIRIDGEINGDVTTKGDLVIGKDGIVTGNVIANNLNLGGKVTGNVDIVNKLVIEANGKLIGDISTKLLAMDETAIIQGKVNMTETQNVAEVKEEAKAEETAEDAK